MQVIKILSSLSTEKTFDRVQLRIGNADTDEKFEKSLQTLLPPLLIELGKANETIRKKVKTSRNLYNYICHFELIPCFTRFLNFWFISISVCEAGSRWCCRLKTWLTCTKSTSVLFSLLTLRISTSSWAIRALPRKRRCDYFHCSSGLWPRKSLWRRKTGVPLQSKFSAEICV